MAKGFGTFILHLEFDKLYIKKIHLWIPSLNIQKENILNTIEIDPIPKGHHRAIMTLYLASGKTVKQDLMVNILPEKKNVQVVNLYDLPQEVVIRPVNAKAKTVAATEVKIEGVDSTFRPVRDDTGVTYALRPGKYEVKIVTSGMDVRSFPIEIKEDVRVYTLPLEDQGDDLRTYPRIEINVPVAYRTEDGSWHSTKTVNISSGGVCLIREPKSAKDKRLYVRLLVPVSAKMVECYANVKWSKDSKVDTNLMGLELEASDTVRNEIRKWLEMHVSMKGSSHNFIKR